MKPQLLEFIKPIINRLGSLTPGQSLLFKAKTSSHFNRTRNLLYEYFKEQNISASFSIKREPNLQMRIVCEEVEPLILVQEQPFTPVEKFVQDNLLDVSHEGEAKATILAAIKQGLCAESDLVPLLTEWRRVQGGTTNTNPVPLNGLTSNLWP